MRSLRHMPPFDHMDTKVPAPSDHMDSTSEHCLGKYDKMAQAWSLDAISLFSPDQGLVEGLM